MSGIAFRLACAGLGGALLVLGWWLGPSARIWPGVSVAGLSLAGRTAEEAAALLRPHLARYVNAPLVLADGDRSWRLGWEAAGVRLNPEASATRAVQAGRTGSLAERLAALVGRVDLAAQVEIDDLRWKAAVDGVAADAERPPREPALTLSAGARPAVQIQAAQSGRRLDRDELRRRLSSAASRLAPGPIALPIADRQPNRDDNSLRSAQATAQQLLAGPLVIRWGEWRREFSPDQIARWLQFAPADGVAAVPRLTPAGAEAIVRAAQEAVNRPAVEGKLLIKDGEPREEAPRSGRRVLADESRQRLEAAVAEGRREVELVVREERPHRDEAALRQTRQRLELLLKPRTLRGEGLQIKLSNKTIAEWLALAEQTRPAAPWRLEVLDDKLAAYVEDLASRYDRPPLNARFVRDGARLRLLWEGQPGRVLDQKTLVARLLQALDEGATTVEVPWKMQSPAITAADLSRLSFPDLIAEGQTSYAGSLPERAHNVELAVRNLQGVVVAPGQRFSFNREVGPTTLAAGYQVGFGIVLTGDGAQTVPSVAGGICQVATTLFQPVFWSGYQIDQRNWHLYWISRYTSNGVVGLDATVDEDYGVDLQFTNSTPQPLLIQATTNGSQITFRLYGVRPTWQVDVEGPAIANVKKADPTMVRQPDPSMPVGKTLQIEKAEDGFTATVVRTVREGAKTRTLRLVSTYEPARNVLLVGTKPVEPEAQGEATGDPATKPAPGGPRTSGQ